MTEVDLELPVPEGEEALDDHPDYLEVADGEEWEELGFGATPDPQPIDISMIPPDEGDDQQGDWDVGASHSAASLAEAALEVGPGPGPLMTPGRMTEKERINARRIAVRAATLALHHAPNVHYTQDSRRWQGIADTRYSEHGQYPNWADCSAFVTWCLWNGLHVPYHKTDVVNRESWKAGYTGTMLLHGHPIRRVRNLCWGDAVIYGAPGTTGRHTALIARVGRPRGSHVMVISHGSEGGPYFLPYNYRSDIQSIRRYIHWLA
jgi:hypothetical protein